MAAMLPLFMASHSFRLMETLHMARPWSSASRILVRRYASEHWQNAAISLSVQLIAASFRTSSGFTLRGGRPMSNQHGSFACRVGPSLQGDGDVWRVDFNGAALAPQPLASDDGRAGATKRLINCLL